MLSPGGVGQSIESYFHGLVHTCLELGYLHNNENYRNKLKINNQKILFSLVPLDIAFLQSGT